MSREWDKRTGCRYFDLEVLCDVSQEGQTFRSFVDRYGTYVFTRAEGFNSRFQVLLSPITMGGTGPQTLHRIVFPFPAGLVTHSAIERERSTLSLEKKHATGLHSQQTG